MSNADELLKWEEYKDPTGKVLGISRQASASMEWLVTATNKKVYAIRFDNNFAKKHLYTSTKKKDKVDALAAELYVKDGSPKGKTKADYMAAAEEQLTQKKFIKQLGHRSGEEQGKTCLMCHHDWSKHFTGSGNPKASGKKCDVVGCTCTGWNGAEGYKQKRATQGKTDVNPLGGATTDKNTVIWMNKIPKATFEAIVVGAILAKEKERAAASPPQAWGHGHTGKEADCEHLDLDFKIPGSVVFIEGSDPTQWKQLQKVNVTVKNGKSADADRPRYSIVHMNAS